MFFFVITWSPPIHEVKTAVLLFCLFHKNLAIISCHVRYKSCLVWIDSSLFSPFSWPHSLLECKPQIFFFFFLCRQEWNFGTHTPIDFQIRNCFLCNLTYQLKTKKRKTENLQSEIALLFRKEKLNNKSKENLFHNLKKWWKMLYLQGDV